MNLLPSLVNFNIHRQFLPLPHSPEVSKHFVILTTDKNAAQSQRRLRRRRRRLAPERQATTHAQHLTSFFTQHPTPTTCLGLPWAALDRLGPLSAFKSKSRNVESLKSVAPPPPSTLHKVQCRVQRRTRFPHFVCAQRAYQLSCRLATCHFPRCELPKGKVELSTASEGSLIWKIAYDMYNIYLIFLINS